MSIRNRNKRNKFIGVVKRVELKDIGDYDIYEDYVNAMNYYELKCYNRYVWEKSIEFKITLLNYIKNEKSNILNYCKSAYDFEDSLNYQKAKQFSKFYDHKMIGQ